MALPITAYANLGCVQFAAEHQKSRVALDVASKAQNSAATGDAFGVFLIGVPSQQLGRR